MKEFFKTVTPNLCIYFKNISILIKKFNSFLNLHSKNLLNLKPNFGLKLFLSFLKGGKFFNGIFQEGKIYLTGFCGKLRGSFTN